MAFTQAIFRRAELLLGDEVMSSIGQKRVIIFGVGGVGSWCAELARGAPRVWYVQVSRISLSSIQTASASPISTAS